MKCPYCGSLMKSGRTEIHGTPLGFLAIGFSYENLYFRAGDEKKIRVLQSGCSTPSLRCPNCEIIILNKDDSDPTIKISDSDFTVITRESIFNSLDLWSSKDKQLEYQKRLPDQNFLEELFYQWINSYKSDSEDFKDVFQIEELNLFSLFNQELEIIFYRLDLRIIDFDSFVNTIDWKRLNLIAKDILKELSK